VTPNLVLLMFTAIVVAIEIVAGTVRVLPPPVALRTVPDATRDRPSRATCPLARGA
jgi:hypothetical protein